MTVIGVLVSVIVGEVCELRYDRLKEKGKLLPILTGISIAAGIIGIGAYYAGRFFQ